MLIFVIAATASGAQDAAKERVIELNDGGRVVLRADGTMGHYDTAGSPIVMTEGVVMTASDGTRILMKGQALWREIVEQVALNLGLASTFPLRRDGADERVIDLLDGGRITQRSDRAMAHYDAAGNHVQMADGEVMTAKDGTRILMTNGALWSTPLNRGETRSGQ
ncbi:MAG: CopK family periplasmic copper-binding protein [Betaproteobacteria bacterium]